MTGFETLPVPTEPRTLFHIVDDLTAHQETLDMLDAQLAEALPDEERAEITQDRLDVIAKLGAIHAELSGKTDDAAFVLHRMDHEYEYQDSEIARLRAKREATDKARKQLRQYIVAVMQRNGIKQLKTPKNTLFLRQTDAVVIEDAGKLPPDVLKATVEIPYVLWRKLLELAEESPEVAGVAEAARVRTEPSLSTIKKQIKAGWPVDGADLALNTSLVLR